MHSSLLSLRRKRSWPQAGVFYIVAVLGIAILSILLGTLATMLQAPGSSPAEHYALGFVTGIVVTGLLSFILSLLILWKKGLMTRFDLLILAIIAGGLGYFGGVLAGTLIPAYLTTRTPRTH